MSQSSQKADVEHQESVPIDIEKHATSSHSPSDPPVQHKFGNPMAIGFGAFALGSFIIGMTNTGVVTNVPQLAIGVAVGFSAVGQLICGIGELLLGNTFAGTSMLTYSGFFFSYGILLSTPSGFLQAATTEGTHELEMCLGLWQIAFAVPSFIFFIGTMRQPYVIRFVLLQVFLTFFFGGLGAFTGVAGLTKAGGWFSFTLAITAWYVMTAILFEEEKFVRLPLF